MNSLPLGTGCPLSRRVDVRGDMGWGVRDVCAMLSAEVCCTRRSWPGLIRLPFKAAFAAAVYGAAGAHETPDNRIAPLACGDSVDLHFGHLRTSGSFCFGTGGMGDAGASGWAGTWGGCTGWDTAEGPGVPTGAPHDVQKRAPCGNAAPHAVQKC